MPRVKKITSNSGLSDKTNLSYDQYLKAAFSILSDNLTIRTYKLAPQNDYPIFERGVDLRVQFYWDKKRVYEFIVDKVFYYMSNRNKEDRQWMRHHADVHINKVKESLTKKRKSK